MPSVTVPTSDGELVGDHSPGDGSFARPATNRFRGIERIRDAGCCVPEVPLHAGVVFADDNTADPMPRARVRSDKSVAVAVYTNRLMRADLRAVRVGEARVRL